MKKLLFSFAALLLLVSTSTSVNAQDLFARRWSLGPVFTGGMHFVTGDMPEGYENKSAFGFSFGALTEIDVSNMVSIDVGLTYLTRSRTFEQELLGTTVTSTLDVSYLALTPMASIKGLLLGFGINLPMSGTSIGKIGDTEQNTEIPSDQLKMVIDFKLGGSIPLMKTDGGELSLLLLGAYDLTRPIEEAEGFEGESPAFGNDASVHLGLTYQFNVSTMK